MSNVLAPAAVRRVPPEQVEKYSSAYTLSDMEIFIYPEMLYSLVLANIMSPRIWAWREDKWFRKLDKLSTYRGIQRLKQFVIDNYEFNLDLETWGLTTKDRELARFRPWMDEKTIAESNALFGYTGDKYYFDVDIRRHFGLDRYTTDTIPYWKTETIEAMDAFRFRPGYSTGAGECVSLSTLYAAALFIVCKVPLDDIFLMATPLHSQNFVDVQDGILTNNRRIVTKAMWFNGTELTAKAQRALRNERVTVVAHNTGWIHMVYPEATIAPDAYRRFASKLRAYLQTGLNGEILGHFLRDHSRLQSCFQVEHEWHGKTRYIAAEKVYSYEHGSSYKVSDETRGKLLEEIDEYEFFAAPIEGRIPLHEFERFFAEHHYRLDDAAFQAELRLKFNCVNARSCEILRDLKAFLKLEPRLPDGEGPKRFVASPPLRITPEMTREEIVEYLESARDTHPVADLAFYAYRDLSRTDAAPFLKAALERNPMSIECVKDRSDAEVASLYANLTPESIYDGARVAQPDEVWNYQRGDGLERAVALANILKSRHPETGISLVSTGDRVRLSAGSVQLEFPSRKGIQAEWNL